MSQKEHGAMQTTETGPEFESVIAVESQKSYTAAQGGAASTIHCLQNNQNSLVSGPL
jgi:hypothetical protein